MHRPTHTFAEGNRSGVPHSEVRVSPPSSPLNKSRMNTPTIEEARIASLKVLALTLLRQVESLEKQIADDKTPELNLQREVHRFEAAIIRSALSKTGGRQRRAARLLGVKVTTLNTKIKRHKINVDDVFSDSYLDPVSSVVNDLLPPS